MQEYNKKLIALADFGTYADLSEAMAQSSEKLLWIVKELGRIQSTPDASTMRDTSVELTIKMRKLLFHMGDIGELMGHFTLKL